MAKYTELGRLESAINKLGGQEGFDALLHGELLVLKKSELTRTDGVNGEQLDGLQTLLQKSVILLSDRKIGDGSWHKALNLSLLELKRLLDNGFPKMPANLKIWKQIKLGTGPKTAKDFAKTLKSGGYELGDWAKDIMGKAAFTVAETETSANLVVLSLKEMGFEKDPTLREIYARALELGLDLCPSEVGPQLRLQYADQPSGEVLIIAMEPIADSDGRLFVFGVARDSRGRWLRTYYDVLDDTWNLDNRFVFVSRNSLYFSPVSGRVFF